MRAPIAWILYANVVFEMMRPTPEPRVARFLDRTAAERIGLSAVTAWEVLNGIGRVDAGKEPPWRTQVERWPDVVTPAAS